MTRAGNRGVAEIRPVSLTLGVQRYAEGSVLIELGQTRVLCAATVEENVPRWLHKSGRGWITAEYAMLPRATQDRTRRENNGLSGRTQEIRRLIGRALRAVVNLEALGERQITIDCDVLQADGGTRTASITGGFVALAVALHELQKKRQLKGRLLTNVVAATSVGVLGPNILLDLDYSEDSHADVDLNVVMTGTGQFIELQGTAEGTPFNRATLDTMLGLGEQGIRRLFRAQQAALESASVPWPV
jgi:ribonuclease PH